MTKTKLNANKRKLAVKVFNRHYANEDNILKTEYYNQRKKFDNIIENAHLTTQGIINRNFNSKDVDQQRSLDKTYNMQNVREDACFFLKSDKGIKKESYQGNTYLDYPEKQFSFDLFGNINDYTSSEANRFAFAYYHDQLKQKGLTPECYVLKGDKKENPHHTQLIDDCRTELGGTKYNNNGENTTSLSKEWHNKYKLSVIGGRSYCNSRIISCTHNEFKIMEDFHIAKQKLIDCYEAWQENIIKRVKLVEDTIKSYTTFEQVEKLAKNQKIDITVNDIEIESTDLAIFNPDNVSAMLDDLKPKAKETRAEKIKRITAYNNNNEATAHG
jgi:hypothetical protein